MREYNIFISHSWTYTDAYEKLTNMLRNAPYFNYNDYSVPKEKSLTIYNKLYYEIELKNKIKNKMKYCNVVLILAGVYSSYSDSINMEIEIANELGKPIIAIEPWGSERTSLIVKKNAKIIVKWNSASIVGAIKEITL